jgi:hypothetical protein
VLESAILYISQSFEVISQQSEVDMEYLGGLSPGKLAGKLLDLAKNPDTIPPIEEEELEPTEVEPDQEFPLEEGEIRLEPRLGTLESNISILRDKVIWAIDGGALSIDIPIGRLIIGRAVIIHMPFSGYEGVQRALVVPAFPSIICGGQAARDVTEAASLYLNEAIKLIPGEIQSRPRPFIEYFSDGQAYLDKFSDSWAGVTQGDLRIARAIDLVRNAAELICFQTALKLANQGDLIQRDGRIHGNIGVWTSLYKSPEGEKALESFTKDVEDAIRRDIRIVGIIKRPKASECCKWLRNEGLNIPYNNDALLYLRTCEELKSPELKFGKRSTLWRYKPYPKAAKTPREKLEQFRCGTAFFYMMAGQEAPPFRVDLPTHYGKYYAWYGEIADQIYTLARGSGSPKRLPHPIVIADNWARVHRAESNRFLLALISDFERRDDPEAKLIANELRIWIKRER